MKRLLVLLVVATLTAGAAGCSSWFNRGSSCGSSPCGQAAASPYMAAPGTVTEGTYLPAPG
jgi:hypothetical protein